MFVDLAPGSSVRLGNEAILTLLDVQGDEADLVLEYLPLPDQPVGEKPASSRQPGSAARRDWFEA